jgi:hypothetical protein
MPYAYTSLALLTWPAMNSLHRAKFTRGNENSGRSANKESGSASFLIQGLLLIAKCMQGASQINACASNCNWQLSRGVGGGGM